MGVMVNPTNIFQLLVLLLAHFSLSLFVFLVTVVVDATVAAGYADMQLPIVHLLLVFRLNIMYTYKSFDNRML